MKFTGSNIIAPAGYIVDVSSKPGSVNTGAFIYRNANGFGSVALTNVRAGIESIPGTFDIKGFAIEMVYIPQGSFYAGDGTGYADLFRNSYADGGSNNPFLVTGNGNTIQLGNTPGKLAAYTEQGLSVFLNNFPTGYSAHWMMKYELSLGGFRDFLNTQTYLAQDSLLTTQLSSPIGTSIINNIFRGKLEIAIPGNQASSIPAVFGCDFSNNNVFDETNDGEWLSLPEANWPVAAAYLDWACLRPFTEMEYEKACRGPLVPVLREYAWGTDLIASGGPYTVSNAGQASETVTNMSSIEGNALYQVTSNTGAIQLRGGAFATATSTRINSGAGYYGAMELTGAGLEYCVGTGMVAGRSFTGRHGNGTLTTYGLADVDFWPGINGNSNETTANTAYMFTTGITETAGLTSRGGYFALGTTFNNLTVSKKAPPLSYISANNSFGNGIRGVRDAN